MRFLSSKVHTIIGLLVGIILIAAPWIFGFADEGTNAWVPHVIVGILVVGYALVTNPGDATITERPPARGPRSTGAV